MSRGLRIPLLLFFLLALAAGCGGPSGPSQPFYIGTWVGNWYDGPYSARFTLKVDETGAVTGGGQTITYTIGSVTVNEAVSILAAQVDEEGNVSGTVRITGSFPGFGVGTFDGTITGKLHASNLRGQGGLTFDFDGSIVSVPWEADRN